MFVKVRNKKMYSGKGEYIGRGTPLGNPYRITDKRSRHVALSMYLQFIIDAIMNEGFASIHHQEITSELNRLFEIILDKRELNLICHCAPKACHGDIIKHLLENKYYTGDYKINEFTNDNR